MRVCNKAHMTPYRIACLVIGCLLLTACDDRAPATTYTIGVVNYVPVLTPVLEGFKAKMTSLGYVEGKNIQYIYHGVLKPEAKVIEHEVNTLLKQKVNLLLTLGTLPTLIAKQATADQDIPVVFAPVIDPIKEGIVQSITHPGGNVTGVQNGTTYPKAMEWLCKIAPHVTQVHVIYHPHDTVARTSIQFLPEVTAALGVALVRDEVHSPGEAIAVVKTLPKDAAIFLVPTPSLEPLSTLIDVAIQHGVAVSAMNPVTFEAGGLFVYSADYGMMGQQAARLANQVLKGTRPADLPVESPEYFLRVNLRTAKAINLNVSDDILRQASTVIR
jgi:putative ABC transport system substrate-binding protein